MNQGGATGGLREWVAKHTGVMLAGGLALTVVTGVVISIVGAAVGNAQLADNGWVVAVLAAVAGWLMRVGYRLGARARMEQVEREIAAVNARLDELEGVAATMSRIEDILRDRPGSPVRQLRHS